MTEPEEHRGVLVIDWRGRSLRLHGFAGEQVLDADEALRLVSETSRHPDRDAITVSWQPGTNRISLDGARVVERPDGTSIPTLPPRLGAGPGSTDLRLPAFPPPAPTWPCGGMRLWPGARAYVEIPWAVVETSDSETLTVRWGPSPDQVAQVTQGVLPYLPGTAGWLQWRQDLGRWGWWFHEYTPREYSPRVPGHVPDGTRVRTRRSDGPGIQTGVVWGYSRRGGTPLYGFLPDDPSETIRFVTTEQLRRHSPRSFLPGTAAEAATMPPATSIPAGSHAFRADFCRKATRTVTHEVIAPDPRSAAAAASKAEALEGGQSGFPFALDVWEDGVWHAVPWASYRTGP